MTTLSPRHRHPRRWATIGVALAACVLPFASAQAAPATDNVATAVVEQDDVRAFDFAWDVSIQKGDADVRHVNSATARASCVGCGATAIAFQIVIVSGSPTTVIPQNLAEAVNVECTDCVTAAQARQFVRVVPEPVQLTGKGRAILNEVRNHLAALETRNLPLDQLHQEVEAQEARVRQVLATELVLKSDPTTQTDVLESATLEDAELG
jgi:putative peptide zinc metalloprotease protein